MAYRPVPIGSHEQYELFRIEGAPDALLLSHKDGQVYQDDWNILLRIMAEHPGCCRFILELGSRSYLSLMVLRSLAGTPEERPPVAVLTGSRHLEETIDQINNVPELGNIPVFYNLENAVDQYRPQ